MALSNMTGNTNNETFIEKDLLEDYLGPSRAQGLPETILLTVIYCIILISGIIGNVCTCIVIYKNQYMRTATNYYLFSLAISDVLTLILGKCLEFLFQGCHQCFCLYMKLENIWAVLQHPATSHFIGDKKKTSFVFNIHVHIGWQK